ncbi:hypothetical protein L195_g060612 [Trifolium pratense]|uniref:Uncharacterized protein n=1 Tax=Trifolium pratense TaxID=57577 RepID=A0A2K3K4W4_TRIPR|nr:hypothetical protein L195_g060612 [Trifolium pratense]
MYPSRIESSFHHPPSSLWLPKTKVNPCPTCKYLSTMMNSDTEASYTTNQVATANTTPPVFRRYYSLP